MAKKKHRITGTIGHGFAGTYRSLITVVRRVPLRAIVRDAASGSGVAGGIVRLVLLAGFAFLSFGAARWAGYLLGWLTGASESPMGVVIAPLVFSLVAILGIRSSTKINLRRPNEILYAAFIAFLVWTVCDYCFTGLSDGVDVRLGTSHYKDIRDAK
jgi:hypothetical protein